MNETAKNVIEAIQIVQSLATEIDEIEALFNKRRGRNPEALNRIRNKVQACTCALTPTLMKQLQQSEEVQT
jgi:tRNA(His) 5'-end guanylyltransferase